MNESNLLAKAVTGQAIRRLAGDTYYQRGLDYFTRGRVASIEVWENTIHAVVSGTEDYAVEITARSGSLDFQCDCPLGEDNEFCKHCVATALAWLSLQDATARPGPGGGAVGGKAPQITTKDIAKVLRSENQATLVELVLKWAREEPGLQRSCCATPRSRSGRKRRSTRRGSRLRRRSASAATSPTMRLAAMRERWVRRSIRLKSC
jgi:hypothetical protein